MNPPLPKAFKEDGFVAVPQFCNQMELSAIESALAHFIDVRVPQLPAEEVFYEDKANPVSLKQIQRLHEHDDFFGEFFNEKPKALAEELLGEPVIGKNLQYFNKPPGMSQATPPPSRWSLLHAATLSGRNHVDGIGSRGRGKRLRALPSGIASRWDASTRTHPNTRFFTRYRKFW